MTADRVGIPWPDFALAASVGFTLELEVFTSGHRRGPLILNVVAVAVMAAASLWRRRASLLFLVTVGVGAIVLGRGLTSISSHYATLVGLYCALFPTYAVGAWQSRRRAIFGFMLWIMFAIGVALVQRSGVGNPAPAVLTGLALWVAGRVMYSQRRLAGELEGKLAKLTAERGDRARLAIAGERMRIARDLHAVVAHSVVGMVVQAEAAERLIDGDNASADVALSTIESTGRGALIELRRILGVLRRADGVRDLEPQPGISRIHDLLRRSRDQGLPIDLVVVGEPGTLSVVTDFGIYRILEEALESLRKQGCVEVKVALEFSQPHTELCIEAKGRDPISWPTPAMRERLTICGGDVRANVIGDGQYLVIRIPSRLRGALT